MNKITADKIRKILPTRELNSNKSTFGKTLIIAGSRNMPGAGILAANASARSGSGYTYLISESKKTDRYKNPDIIFLNKNDFKNNFNKMSAIAVGPGLVSNAFVKNTISTLLKHNFSDVVLDAGALNVLPSIKSHSRMPSSWILTPHEGEMSKLLGKSVIWVKNNREQSVYEAYIKYGCNILLKGSKTLIFDGEQICIVSEGTPALAKAGTGDVLCGMIAALMSQKLNAFSAACAASFIHGRAAKIWENSGRDQLSLMASDLNDLIPLAITSVRNSKSKIRKPHKNRP